MTASITSPSYRPLGDSALTIALGEGISLALSEQVLRVASSIRESALGKVTEIVPAYASLTLFYDSLQFTYLDLLARVRPLVEESRDRNRADVRKAPRTIRIPVRYDGEDLSEVAERTGHSVHELISLHSGREYHVFMIGFVPGFAYMGELDPSLVLPRRASPRKRVLPGSVAVAEAQTGVYPFATPGGWHLIGRTDVKMFDPTAREPAVLRVGDRVLFDPIGE